MHSAESDSAVGPSIEELLRNDVRQRTNGAIRDLTVEIDEGTVTLSGTTGRYYNKQLATSAVLDIASELDLNNEIEVQPARPK